MRILYIASVRIPNEKASGLAIMRQCEAFAQAGHDVTLLRPHRANHITEDPFVFYGVERSFDIRTMNSVDFFISFGKVSFYAARLSQMLAGLVYVLRHAKDIELIYARDPWMLYLILLLFRQKKTILWEAHQLQKGRIVAYVARKASVLVCISKGLAQFYAGVKSGTILIEPSGVNVDQFKDLPPVEEVRVRYNVPIDKNIVGYIGKYKTMGESKGVDELIEAIGLLDKAHNAHLLIVGLENSEIAMVKDVCKMRGVSESDYTLLPLIQKDFALYVHACDIVVMNYPDTEHYRTYMSPTKLFSYMASGKLIVASDLLSVREIVDEGMAVFVRPDSVPSLKGALGQVLTEKEKYRNLTARAYVEVSRYTWKNRALRITHSVNTLHV